MKYTKMHGAGNSFVIIEISDSSQELSEIAIELCSLGGHSDGLIAVCPYEGEDADFRMLFYNSDGTLGEMCGNGARCVCRYGYEHGYSEDAKCIRVMTTAGLVVGERIDECQYKIKLNDPSIVETHTLLSIDGAEYDGSYVELGKPGIPHCILEVDIKIFEDLNSLRELGRKIRYYKSFPKGANVTFASLVGENEVKAITYERGVEDFTLACGTGSGATAVILALRGVIKGNNLMVNMPGGKLDISYTKTNNDVCNIYLTGPTEYVLDGYTNS